MWIPLAQRETFVDRMARRMQERKAARMAAAAKAPKRRELSAADQAEAHLVAHARTVDAELKAIDARVVEIEKLLARSAAPAAPTFGPTFFADGQRFGGAVGGADYQSQELLAERRQLRELRASIEQEHGRPITVDREGRALTERDYAILRARSREIAESCREHAERYARSGDHREARRHSVDSYRGRHIAEHEQHVRAFLPGYSQPWT